MILEKPQNKVYAKSKPQFGFKDTAVSGMPDPDDFESDDEHTFDPSARGNYDKVSRHERFGKFYRDANNKKIWYSKDRAGHGGEHWKKFVETDGDLHHVADIDMKGNIMTKHKGPIGRIIDGDQLIGIK